MEQLTFESSKISGMNRFVAFSTSFVRKDTSTDFNKSITFGRVIEKKEKGFRRDVEETTFKDVMLYAASGDRELTEELIFFDNVIGYDQIHMILKIDAGDELSSVILKSIVGIPDHTIFQMYFRIVFSIFALLFLIMLVVRLKFVPMKHWHIEQKLTLGLLAANFLYCNPIYLLHCYYPSTGLLSWNVFVEALFAAYFAFFVLVLFDSLRYRNKKSGVCFLFPKAVFAAVVFVVTMLHTVAHDIRDTIFTSINDPHMNSDFARVMDYARAIVVVIFCVWVFTRMFASLMKVDVTEKYKVNMYVATVAACVIVTTAEYVLKKMHVMDGSAVFFVVSFTLQNVFVLTMAYCHWPYEVLHDQGYVENAADRLGETEGFFANSDEN